LRKSSSKVPKVPQSAVAVDTKSLAKLRARAREKGKKLQELAQILGASFDALNEGILVIDYNMNIIILNRYMRDLFKIEDNYEGKKCYEVIQGSLIPCRGTSCRRVMFKKAGEEEELVLIMDGRKRIFEVRTYPWDLPDAEIKGVIRTFTDITNRRAVEESQILAGVSKYMAHTVRNALMPLGGYLKIITKECADEETRSYFTIVEDALKSLDEAVDEYVDFVRVRGQVLYGSVDLMKLIQLLPDLVSGDEAKDIGLSRYMEQADIRFHIVPGSFRIWGNEQLLIKGLLYMVKGCLQTCRDFCAGRGSLNIEAEVKGESLELIGELQGAEVPEVVLVTMFQPWSYAHQEPSFQHWSVAILNEVVLKHGGKLVVKRELGSTVFHVSFFRDGLSQDL